MTARRKKNKAEPAPPTTLFLFGAHGDLVKRLLMPALYNLSRDGLLDDRAKKQNLCKLLPASVPSGFPIMQFGGCPPPK